MEDRRPAKRVRLNLGALLNMVDTLMDGRSRRVNHLRIEVPNSPEHAQVQSERLSEFVEAAKTKNPKSFF